MNVKIQGSGNGTYANTGSCVAVTNYLQHEDLERMKKGEEVQPFFNQFRDYVSAREVTFKIDNNKAKLSRTDAKFYVITVSPSEKELRCMGRTPQECAEALRRYIRQDVMRNYAEGFGKGLKSDDVEYYAKIHFNRDGESDSDMHAHIIVSPALQIAPITFSCSIALLIIGITFSATGVFQPKPPINTNAT